MMEDPAAQPVTADALYRAHVRPLYMFIYNKVGNREAAEDITSDVFVKALTHIDPSRDERSIIAWLYRVARNAVTDYWRAGRGARVIALDDARLGRDLVAPVEAARQDKAAGRANALLERLPERYRAVLSYRLLQGLSVTETAQRMGTTEANVKVMQHRALKQAASLQEDNGDHGR
jgi:RNA polymerase sigma-70 factor (ECF subfamily)